MKIAIVNDTVMAIEALRRVLLTVPDYKVTWVAKDGVEAVTRCRNDPPDLVLMDLIMPNMDGVEATKQIMQQSPCAILIVTADVGRNAGKVFEAMGYGALDAVDTPVFGIKGNLAAGQPLLAKIATISKLIKKPTTNIQTRATVSSASQPASVPLNVPELIAIGSSTGGPKVLATILSRLPANFRCAIVIVQHVDRQFAGGLVDWLAQQTPLKVKLATVGDRPEKGIVLVAGTNDHLSLRPDLSLHYIKEPVNYPYRPSVDVFFKSLAAHWKRKATAVLLTGMGRDGGEGLSILRRAGWHTIAQDEQSCVVYGMPKAAVELDAAIDILNPEEIAKKLLVI